MAAGIQWAVRSLFTPKGDYDDLRRRCREYATKHYSWERHTDQLRSILDEIL
jgi:glycosyltransferase involved in cell wall biosynthesis